MKSYPTPDSPFAERLYYTDEEIETICADELRSVGLLPRTPEAIRIDRFIEKRFHVTHSYAQLPAGLLGYTKFGKQGVEEVVLSQTLADEGTKVAERRISTTLAHEGGHAIFQMQLFVMQAQSRPQLALQNDIDLKMGKILCRSDIAGEEAATAHARRYDGRWWELQANRAIGALLLPRSLVRLAVQDIAPSRGFLDTQTLPTEMRAAAVQILAQTFNVNPAVAWIRVDQLFPSSNTGQLTF